MDNIDLVEKSLKTGMTFSPAEISQFKKLKESVKSYKLNEWILFGEAAKNFNQVKNQLLTSHRTHRLAGLSQ